MSDETVTTSPQTEAVSSPPVKRSSGLSARKKIAIFMLLASVIGVVVGLNWLINSRKNITTDNAFVESNIHPIAARIYGKVIAVHVNDNQLVQKGELLLELDSSDYTVAVARAEAALGVAQNETSGDTLQVAASRAAVRSAQASLEQSRLDLERGENLYTKEVIPKQQLDQLRTNHLVAEAQLLEAKQRLKKDEALAELASGPAGKARIREKQAELENSRLKLSYTEITAPVTGYVTRKGAEAGFVVEPGQALLAVVPLDDTWVTANYKESQLTNIRPGQQVSFRVDSYPGKTFKGRVDSIMAGTGAAFSLLPPENATGNYVKVVQRIPVKICIDKEDDPDHLLRVGMSVIPTVHTGRTTGEVLRELNPFR